MALKTFMLAALTLILAPGVLAARKRTHESLKHHNDRQKQVEALKAEADSEKEEESAKVRCCCSRDGVSKTSCQEASLFDKPFSCMTGCADKGYVFYHVEMNGRGSATPVPEKVTACVTTKCTKPLFSFNGCDENQQTTKSETVNDVFWNDLPGGQGGTGDYFAKEVATETCWKGCNTERTAQKGTCADSLIENEAELSLEDALETETGSEKEAESDHHMSNLTDATTKTRCGWFGKCSKECDCCDSKSTCESSKWGNGQGCSWYDGTCGYGDWGDKMRSRDARKRENEQRAAEKRRQEYQQIKRTCISAMNRWKSNHPRQKSPYSAGDWGDIQKYAGRSGCQQWKSEVF